MIKDYRGFLYNGDKTTGRIFEKGEEIPEGWYDGPNQTTWNKVPKQPTMKNTMVWDDAPDVAPVEVDEPASDEAPEVFYCDECDKTYKDKSWYERHMLNIHSIPTKGTVGVE